MLDPLGQIGLALAQGSATWRPPWTLSHAGTPASAASRSRHLGCRPLGAGV